MLHEQSDQGDGGAGLVLGDAEQAVLGHCRGQGAVQRRHLGQRGYSAPVCGIEQYPGGELGGPVGEVGEHLHLRHQAAFPCTAQYNRQHQATAEWTPAMRPGSVLGQLRYSTRSNTSLA